MAKTKTFNKPNILTSGAPKVTTQLNEKDF